MVKPMNVDVINIGFGNLVMSQKVMAILNTESAPIKRMIQEARDGNRLIDATFGRKTRAVLAMDNGQLILSALQPETISHRIIHMDGGVSSTEDAAEKEETHG